MQIKKSYIIRKLCIWLALWNISVYAAAQTTVYPVQAYTQLTLPYTPYVPSYYSGGVEKLRVTLINADMKQPLLEVFMRMQITSSVFSLQTPVTVSTPVITLPAGVPTILSQSDLEPYFRRENLQITGGQSQFLRSLMLPDNYYRFHFEVYEAHTGRLLSNTRVGFAQALIAAGDPPVPNLPLKGSVVEESNIPSILFTWTPRHLNSVASAYGTEYELSLVEIHDKQTSAENAFQYSRVLHSERTRSTAFIYNSAHPILQPGLRYAWRVQAVAREGLEDAQVFKNNGYSEIFWFDYKGNCPTVASSGVIIKGTEAAISWQPTQAIGYTLKYRKKGGTRWYNGNVSGASGTLYGLQWGETYEYRIGSRCYPNDLFDYSPVKSFTMPALPEKNPNCGIMPDDNLTNRTPINTLTPGLPIFAGDFPIFITEVHGNGVFSGTGYVGIPFTKLPRITVTFSNITVNSDHRLIGGFFETKYDIKNSNVLWDVDQTLTGGKGVGDIRSGEERAQFVVDYAINPNIKVKPVVSDNSHDEIKEGDGGYVFTKNENGKYTFIITDSEGKEHKIESDTMPVTIADNGGAGEDSKTYQIDEQGNITQISSGSNIKLDPSTSYKVGTDIVEVEFAEIEGVTRYAVDSYKDVYKKVTEYYQQYKAGDKEIAASAKFMLPGTSDKLAVKIKSSKAEFDPAKVHFVTMAGKEYEAVYMPDSRQWGITVVASEAGDGQELFAVYETEQGKYATIALLNIYTYKSKNIKIKLVPVNGFTNGFTKENVSAQLNTIYNKVGISCEVEMAPAFNYTLQNNAFNVTGSGLFSTLTDDMKAINSAYLQANPDENAMCLFIIENATGNEGVVGDMPRGKQFGYLFKGSTTQTIAHEIGHGVFHLDHPFDRANAAKSFDRGDLADNLMEYVGGTNLVKLQWDAIHSPGLVIGAFEKDEAGQLAILGGVTWLGDLLGGLAKDEQEKEIEKMQKLFDHVYDGYTDYFEKSKTADINLAHSDYKDWSVRQSSHSNNIAKSIYDKFNQKQDNTFKLNEKGVYLENYDLEGKSYQVAVYSTKTIVELKNDKVRLKGYKELANHTYVKAGYTKKYGIIVMYDDSKKFQMMLQVSGADKPEKIAAQWLNYLAIVVASEEQKEYDKDYVMDRIKENISKIFTIGELSKVWEEEESTVSKPKPGDPLIEMLVQGTDPNNENNRIGGTYGCKRYTPEPRTQCDEWAKNIIDFPHVNGKNKVHDGLDLTAPTNTPVYSMYEGTVINAGYSQTLGNYVLIKSTKVEHNISTEQNAIYVSYGHLSSYVGDLTGKKVEQGILIGYTGNSGSIAQNIDTWQYHLHLTIYNGPTNNKYNRVNPIKYLNTKFDVNGNKM